MLRSGSGGWGRGALVKLSSPDRLTALLPTLRRTLIDERAFRLAQLAHVPAEVPGCGAEAEIQAILSAGARQALNDIELALARMRGGEYGRCRTCEVAIAVAVLLAVPMTTLCLSCRATAPTPVRWTGSVPLVGASPSR